MRFLVDESTGLKVASWLKSLQHDVFSVYDQARGFDDDRIMQKANKESYIIITNDKGFGELIIRKGYPHKGLILLRLNDETSTNKIRVLKRILDNYSNQLEDNFIIASEKKIRLIKRN